MEISVQSHELIEALSERLSQMTIELETMRIALKKAQDGIVELEQAASRQVEQLPFAMGADGPTSFDP